MNFKSLMLFTCVLICIVAFIYFFERHTPGTDERLTRAKQIFSFDEQSIVSLTLTNHDESSPFEIIKQTDTGFWRFSRKGIFRASDDTIISLLTDLKFLTSKRNIVSSDADLEAIGLKNPAISIEFSDNTFDYSLYLGSQTAIGEQVYAMAYTKKHGAQGKGNRHIIILDTIIKESLDLSFAELRSQDAMPKLSFVPDRITIERDSLTIEIIKNNDNMWSITKPLLRKADDTTINELLISFQNLKILDFVTDAAETVTDGTLELYGISLPRAIVTLYGGSKSASLRIGASYNADRLTYVQNSFEPDVYGIDTKMTPVFFSSLFSLSARQLSVPALDQLYKIQLRKTAQELTLVQQDGQWRIVSPVEVRADIKTLSALIDTLRAYKIIEYIVDKELRNEIISKIGLDSYTVVFTMADQPDTSVNYTLFEDAATNNTYAIDSRTELLQKISINRKPYLPYSAVELADIDIILINRHHIKEFSFTGESGTFSLINRDGSLYQGEKRLIDDDAQAVFSALEQIKASRFTDMKTDDNILKSGLNTPQFELHFIFSAETETGSNSLDLYFGNQHDIFQFGYAADYPLIFLVEEATIKAVQQVLRQCVADPDNQD